MNKKMLSRFLTGAIVIGAGVLILLQQLGFIHISIGSLISLLWPLILVYVGLEAIIKSKRHENWWGYIVLGLGVIFLGRNFGWFYISFGTLVRFALPIIIIAYGLRLMFKPREKQHEPPADEWKYYHTHKEDNYEVPPAPPLHPDPTKQMHEDAAKQSNPNRMNHEYMNKNTNPRYSSSTFNDQQYDKYDKYDQYDKQHRDEYYEKENRYSWSKSDPNTEYRSAFIGDVHIGDDYWEVKPLNISSFIGDTTLDLTKAQIPPTETKIYVSSFIGDVKVYLPNDYDIAIQVVSNAFIGEVKLMGKKEGGMFTNIKVNSPYYEQSSHRIKLIVSTFIGDVRVTKVG